MSFLHIHNKPVHIQTKNQVTSENVIMTKSGAIP